MAHYERMLTATTNLFLSRTEEDLRAAVRYIKLPVWMLRSKITCALICHKLHSSSIALSQDVITLLDLSRAIDADSAEQIDEDGRMAERFSSALATVKRIHKNAGYTRSQAQRIKNEKMVAAAAMLVAVCDEYYRAVCQLAWAVAEHDATHAPRLSGFAAESPEEACAMLDRIAFG